MERKILHCKTCGNVVLPLTLKEHQSHDGAMEELIPNTKDAAVEKHVPIFSLRANHVHVEVGSVHHPMSEEHYIEWVMLETTNGVQIRYLKPNDAPEADFYIAPGEGIIRVLAYCNLHGLWSKNI